MTSKLDQARKELTQVFLNAWKNGDYFPTEFQPETNDITRSMISAFAGEHGQVWLGQINLYGKDRGQKAPILKPCTGFVYNFEASFIVPVYDQLLVDMIYDRDIAKYTGTKSDSIRVGHIMDRIEQLGGLMLHWV